MRETTRVSRLCIVSPRREDAALRESEAERFDRMVRALRRGGLEVDHITASDPTETGNEFDRLRPDMIFGSFFRFPAADTGGARYLRDIAIAAGIAWIGSYSDTMELALSKPRMKAHLRLWGIPTPDWFTVRKLKDGSIDGLELIDGARDFPYIVKPAGEGNSRGIDEGSVVRQPLDLHSKASSVAERYGEALIEKFVSGGEDSREFTIAMIGNGEGAIVAPVEIVKKLPGSSVIAEADKEYQTTAIRPIEDRQLRAKVVRLARKVFLTARARDYARCDILLYEGKLYVIEMNGQPMVPDRWFAACAMEAGLDEDQYLNAIVLASMLGNAKSGYAFVPLAREMQALLPKPILERLML